MISEAHLLMLRLRGEIVRIASGVDILRSLVHPHVVDGHHRRECQVLEIDGSEVGRNSQVNDHNTNDQRRRGQRGTVGREDKHTNTIGSCGTGHGQMFTLSSVSAPPAFIVHALLLSLTQVIYCTREKGSHQLMIRRGRGRGKKYVPRCRLRIRVPTGGHIFLFHPTSCEQDDM